MSPTRARLPPPASESKTICPESPVLMLQSRAGDAGRSVLGYGSQGDASIALSPLLEKVGATMRK